MKEASEGTRKRQEYYDVVLNRLFSTITNLGEMLDCEESMQIEELLKHPCIIELDQLARDEQNLLVEWFLFWIYTYRLAQGHRGSLRHVLIFDEAKRVFDANKEFRQTASELGVAPIDIVTDEIRDFGEAIIASDQEPSKLTHSIKANTYTKIAGFLGHGKDVSDIAEAMDLDEEERGAIAQLERGEWLVKLAGRYTKPFMMRSMDFPIKKDMSDEELKERMKRIIERLRVRKARTTGRRKMKQKNVRFRLSEDAWSLLKNINFHPFKGITSRSRMLGISARRIERAKNELLEGGLVKQVNILITGGRPTSFLVLTSSALQLLKSRRIDTRMWSYVGNVGFKHMLYQVLIRWEFEKLGYDAHIEANLPSGRRIDVLAIGDRRIGVEVELKANEVRHKLNGVDSLDELYIVTDREILQEIRLKVGSLPSNVKLYSIGELLLELRNRLAEGRGKIRF
jgi:hypothetical protein